MLSLLFWRTCDSATNLLFVYFITSYITQCLLLEQKGIDCASKGRSQSRNTPIKWFTFDIRSFYATWLTYLILFFSIFRYGRWVTRKIAVATIIIIWLLAAFVSFVPISFGLHRPDQPVIYLDSGKKYPTCALDLTPTYAVVSSCISFYVPCIVMIGIYCR